MVANDYVIIVLQYACYWLRPLCASIETTCHISEEKVVKAQIGPVSLAIVQHMPYTGYWHFFPN